MVASMSGYISRRFEITLSLVLGIAVVASLGAQTQSEAPDRMQRFVDAAILQTRQRVVYDGSYRRIPYPNGDVPADRGVCTDVLIRAYRSVGVDLQQRVHEDMRSVFGAYPKHWGLSQPDPNIDHRRVPNLQTFFRRKGAQLPISAEGRFYRTGDVVTWMLPGNLPHIGIITHQHTADGARPLIIHNIGRGPEVEDMLFRYPITGH